MKYVVILIMCIWICGCLAVYSMAATTSGFMITEAKDWPAMLFGAKMLAGLGGVSVTIIGGLCTKLYNNLTTQISSLRDSHENLEERILESLKLYIKEK